MKKVLEKIAQENLDQPNPYLVADLIKQIRPKFKFRQKKNKFLELVELLEQNEELRQGLRDYLQVLLRDKKFFHLLVDTGIITSSNNFIRELIKRIVNKFLPEQPKENTVDFLMTNSFYRSWDHEWIEKIDDKEMARFIKLIEVKPFSMIPTDTESSRDILFSIEVITQRIAGKALDSNLMRMVPEYENLTSPFLALQKEIDIYISEIQKDDAARRKDNVNYKHILVLISQCKDYLKKAVKNRGRFGITLNSTIRMLQIEQELDRLEMILRYYTFKKEGDEEEAYLETAHLFDEILKKYAERNQIKTFAKEATQLLAYQVTQHTGKTGEHYITDSKKDYWKMFMTASGGGMIVGLLCVIKVFLAKTGFSPFGMAFLYSLNYALGFIAIYLLHFTLATKQPAMTAATLAAALTESKKQKQKYRDFAILFAQLFRSQFIAFVGNVIIAFPIALLFAYGILAVFDYDMMTTEKSAKMIKDLSPVHSLAIFHASIAGLFLFLSGLISGFIMNRNVHHNIAERIKKHPVLRFTMKEKTRTRLADWYHNNIGGISGNFWFGVFMGSTASIGIFFGLNLDIRHITFASGNFALGLFGHDFQISFWQWFWAILGIGLIGFFNFIISFAFSLLIAMRSRKIKVFDLIKIVNAIRIHFFRHPFHYFFPFKDKF